jgi:putative ABC transport system permease protein
VADELRRIAGGRVDVLPADQELSVLDETAKPLRQSTTLFASISAMVGFLLALNAVLLTVPDRRRFVGEMCAQGFDTPQLVLILGFQAIVLGVGASLVGLALGYVLAHTLFAQSPVYLAAAFPISVHQTVHLSVAFAAFCGGVLATMCASLPPIFGLRSGRPVVALASMSSEAGQRISTRTAYRLGGVGLALIGIVTLFVLLAPGLTVIGGVLLALATPCLIPAVFIAAMRGLRHVGRRTRNSMLPVAVIELSTVASRSLALIAVAALAIYGSVAIQGARHDLTSGLDGAVVEYLDTAPVWVAPNNNFLTIDSFKAGNIPKLIANVPGVASVHSYLGGVLDIGARRIWIRARPATDQPIIQASQLLHGQLAEASALIRHGGWAAVSSDFASERHLHAASPFLLPTPSGPAVLRVAAITTNTGWSPGAITINAKDYERYWRTSDPTALEVGLRPGVSPVAGKRAVERALGSRPGLRVEALGERVSSFEHSAREGLRSLGEISTLLLITTALAVALVLSATIWQRRARLASLKTQGFDNAQLWRALLMESAIAVSIGSVEGATLGFYGHALASRWLLITTGFPAPFGVGLAQVALALVVVVSITLAMIAIPGLAAARVAPRLGFQD